MFLVHGCGGVFEPAPAGLAACGCPHSPALGGVGLTNHPDSGGLISPSWRNDPGRSGSFGASPDWPARFEYPAATCVGASLSFATGVSYFPSGAMKQLTYGNGIVHKLAQNTRGMAYDNLGRLTQTTSPSAVFNTASYGYDVLDNLTTVSITGGSQARNHSYVYDATTRRLSQVKNAVGGAIIANLVSPN